MPAAGLNSGCRNGTLVRTATRRQNSRRGRKTRVASDGLFFDLTSCDEKRYCHDGTRKWPDGLFAEAASTLTDAALKHLGPKDKIYKVTDRDGMYALVSTKGSISFRLGYRMNWR